MKFRNAAHVGVLVLLALGACTGDSDEGVVQQNGFASPAVSTDQTSYPSNPSVTINWANMPGNPNDWVAIVTAGSPPDSGFVKWNYTGGLVTGSMAFSGFVDGNYEARAYLDSSYVVLANSTFSVGTFPNTNITTDQANYAPGAAITVNWTGMPGNADDFVTLSAAGSPPDSGIAEWTFTNSQVNGTYQFNGLANGSYEARAYGNGFTVLHSTPFTVSSGAATVSTDHPTYSGGQPITVSWVGLPGNANDWVAIVTANSPPDSGFIQWNYAGGQQSGSMVFNGTSSGNYEARAYLNGSYTILGTSSFAVDPTSATITTDMQTYNGEPVTLSWAGMPGNANDWVAIVPANSPPDSGFVQWNYIGGQPAGSLVFNPVTPGSYEARAYRDGSFMILATSTFQEN